MMLAGVWLAAVTFSLTLLIAHAFPEGVPLNSCTKQMVDAIPPYAHLVKTTVYNVSCYPQSVNLTGGFIYTFSSTTWKAGEPLSLNITDTTGVGIRGFFFQAFDSARNRVGTWTFSPYPYNATMIQGQIINCPDGQAVAHTGVLGNSKKTLRPHFLQLNVTIPTAGVGTIEVAGIVLTDRTIWYLDNLQTIAELEPANTPTELIPTPSTTLAQISAAEVALHNNATSCWTVYNGMVYDQTYWVPYHPGPGGIAIMRCGQDGTSDYNTFTNLHNMSRINLYTAMIGAVTNAAVTTATTAAPSSTSSSTAVTANVTFSTSIVIILVIGAVVAVGLLAVGIFRALNPSSPSNVQLSRTAQMINKQTNV